MSRPDWPATLATVGTIAASVGAALFHPGLGLVVFGILLLAAAVLTAQAGEPDADAAD